MARETPPAPTPKPRRARPAAGRDGAARPRTIGQLRAAGWTSRTVKDEMRANLLSRLGEGEPLFPGIVGYDDTVVPAIENAILAGHDLVFLG